MIGHPSISWSWCTGLVLCSLGLFAPGCDPSFPDVGTTVPAGQGRMALRWQIGGMALTPDRCKTEKIDSMEVDLAGELGQVGYTQVRCDLDRYSLDMTPEGRVAIEVRAIGRDRTGRLCLRYVGDTMDTAGTNYPDKPTLVDLQPVVSCR